MKIKKHIAISDSGVVYNGATGDSYSVNPIASEIVNLIKAKKTQDDIRLLLLSKYDVELEQLEGDLLDFLTHLRQLNLMESDE